MRFDFIPFFNPGKNIPWTQTVDMYRTQTQLAEQANFQTVWLTEHHFAHNGWLNATPNPILMCADLAAHCHTIRVGTSPIVLPDWHPLRVAEDIALLDNLTGGRVEFGVGRGINERACMQFNLDADRRDDKKSYRLFLESLDIILKAWTEDPFSYQGEFYQFPVPGWKESNRFFQPYDQRYHKEDGEYIAMQLHPKPLQTPYPPIWMMSNAPHVYRVSGEKGYNMLGMSAPPGQLRTSWEAYQQSASVAQGRHLQLGENVGVCVVIYVAETQEEADTLIRPSINHYYEFLAGARPLGEWARKGYLEEGEELSTKDKEAEWYDFLTDHNLIWIGTADHVVAKIQSLQSSINLQHIVLLQQFPSVPYAKILASMERFAKHVMPHFI